MKGSGCSCFGAMLVLLCALRTQQIVFGNEPVVAVGDDSAKRLLELLPKRFRPLTSAEENLLKAVPTPDPADCSSDNDEQNDPAQADTWGDERTIRADLIRWLCVDRKASQLKMWSYPATFQPEMAEKTINAPTPTNE